MSTKECTFISLSLFNEAVGSKNQATATQRYNIRSKFVLQKIGDNESVKIKLGVILKKKWGGVKQDLIELFVERCLTCSSRNNVRQLMVDLVEMSPDGEYKYILHAPPTILQPDNGKEFNSQVIKELVEM
ncbi:21683_t:CDS:2 [Entrophospora sp. SA101]|nr:6602_t:CDS:2 [Entrophospora sp. SA101]CAJ0763932.1 21683_t:CDS:2 [Entrophospora sp. SA101]